jgi:hypothetical protein
MKLQRLLATADVRILLLPLFGKQDCTGDYFQARQLDAPHEKQALAHDKNSSACPRGLYTNNHIEGVCRLGIEAEKLLKDTFVFDLEGSLLARKIYLAATHRLVSW